MKAVKVYIPNELGRAELGFLKEGSAIVAYFDPSSTQSLDAYCEGNVYDCSNLRTFEEKAVVAAGRLQTRYPTVARCHILRDLLLEVGELQMIAEPAPPNYKLLPAHLRKRFAPRERLRFVATGNSQQLSDWVGD